MIKCQAGTCVAISLVVMRLSETITIYLAAGAPFGVASFLRAQPGGGGALALLKATGATLLWPFAASAILLARGRHLHGQSDTNGRSIDAPAEERVARAQRDLLAFVYRVFELAQESAGLEREKMELAACRVRESVEKYTGLAMAAVEIKMRTKPDSREMELCRISGRTGDDLLLAGLCVHRRNISRINAHLDRARAEIVHALAEMREVAYAPGLNSQTNVREAGELSEALLTSYGHAIEMFSLLDDQGAAMSVGRLLDVEAARLRRLEAAIVEGAHEASALGEEQCTPHVPQTLLTGLSQRSNLSRG
ncbi:MAG TPA: hypothetical protein VF708_14860 [Pyrinomonadaceae bacterium]